MTLLETIAAGEHWNSDLQLTCHQAQLHQVSMTAEALLQDILANPDQRIYKMTSAIMEGLHPEAGVRQLAAIVI